MGAWVCGCWPVWVPSAVSRRLGAWREGAAFALNRYDVMKKILDKATELDLAPEAMDQLRQQMEEYEKLWAEEQEILAREAEADDLPRVKLTTTKGDIVVELFENEAPDTVGNFISLVKKGFYDDLTFHRVLAGFMAQVDGSTEDNDRFAPVR